MHGFNIRRRIDAVRIISLIEHQFLKYGFIVEHKIIPLIPHIAQSEITVNGILSENDRNVIEPPVSDLPSVGFRKFYFAPAVIFDFAEVRADASVFIKYFYPTSSASVRQDIYRYFRFCAGRIKSQLPDARFRNEFQPNILPNARCSGIKTPERIFLYDCFPLGQSRSSSS